MPGGTGDEETPPVTATVGCRPRNAECFIDMRSIQVKFLAVLSPCSLEATFAVRPVGDSVAAKVKIAKVSSKERWIFEKGILTLG